MHRGVHYRRVRLRRNAVARCVKLTLLLLFIVDAQIVALPLLASTVQSGATTAQQVSLGQTIDQVTAILGEPDQIVDLDTTVIYVYNGRRVTFSNGKVTQMDAGLNAPSPRSFDTGGDRHGYFEDVFSQDYNSHGMLALNRTLWTADSELLRSISGIASSPSSAWVAPKLSLSSAGLRMSGITDVYRFTGIQSRQSVQAPFTLSAAVTGTVSHGNAFELFLVSGDLRRMVSIGGNLNPASGYQGIWETVRGDGNSQPAVRIYDTPACGTLYLIDITVDARGQATISVRTPAPSRGGRAFVLAAEGIENLGEGPFYVVLAQREGLPYSVGRNEAVWRNVSVAAPSVPERQDLHLRITSVESSGAVVVNGLDNQRPTRRGFTWIWGDGATTQGWFPQSHIYADTSRDYTLRVISHEDDGATGTAQLLVHFQPSEVAIALGAGPDCLRSGGPEINNDIHGGIRIIGGSGSLFGLSSLAKTIVVSTGASLSGSVRLRVTNGGSASAVAPLIGTVSWGDPSHAFWTVSSWVHPGTFSIDAPVDVTAPAMPGRYHLVFAMALELSGSNVASATNWALRRDVWGDGNDIARISPAQIGQAQRNGCMVGSWLTTGGYRLTSIPADVITVEVR